MLVLHGTGGSAASMLDAGFAGELFGPGQPLDASKYYIILPDGIGHGKSSKPSDGLRMKFPQYDYDDMVEAQYRLLTEGLGIRHLRLVIGNSMGGMQTWLWGEKYPDFMDALVPMASQPTAMAGRNWMLRRMMIETIRRDPEWQQRQLHQRSRASMKHRQRVLRHRHQRRHARLSEARRRRARRPTRSWTTAWPRRSSRDANDFLYQWESSRDYDAAPGLERIEAAVLAINAADDERNPPETGVMERALKRVKNGRLYLIPASDETRGHGTTGMAKFYTQQLRELLQTAPQRAM